MSYNIILFDLDGTLTDPKVGITKSVQYALKKLGIAEPNLDKLTPFIGPPLMESFTKIYNFNEEKAWQGVEYYRSEYFTKKGMLEDKLYEGIPELLEKLYQSKSLYVVTSKPTLFSEKIIRHFHLDKYFKKVIGPDLDVKNVSKKILIKSVVDMYPNEKKESFVMIGDREHDILGAQANGIDSVGVLYGYGSQEEIKNAEPTQIIKTVEDLENLLL